MTSIIFYKKNIFSNNSKMISFLVGKSVFNNKAEGYGIGLYGKGVYGG